MPFLPEPPSIIATPQRVFVKLPNTPILVSDYVFQDEEPKDVSAHFLELLNISVIEEEVDFSCEQMPGKGTIISHCLSHVCINYVDLHDIVL